MEIKYNKDGSVTINATELEHAVLCAAVGKAYSQSDIKDVNNIYKPVVDAMNNAYNEQVLDEGL